jgi:CHAT domain-containing protein
LGLTNTELLVLSACQTAQVTEIEGVGLSGLAYVWERAGAKSIIASLWNVSDQKSSEMMTQFYANLKQGMSKAEAMRQAKLSFIKKNKHPFLWSPFILIGDAR